MDKNRVQGMGKQVKGSVKEAVGRAVGDRSTQFEGKGEKTAGKVQAGYGRVKDEARAAKQEARERKSGR